MASYITAAEADELAAAYCPQSEFLSLSDERKEALLRLATISIDAVEKISLGMGFNGKKLEISQENEFPRDLYNPVPFAVKLACCVEAAALAGGEDAERLKLRRGGVSSVSIAGASESFRPVNRSDAVISMAAMTLLLPFINKGEAAEII